jgi:vacuolar-type H+-ATPase subunit H
MIDWEKARDTADTIIETIDDVLPHDIYSKAPEFFEGVRERAYSMREWIREHERATPKQIKALDNMDASVRAWLK